MSTIQVTAYGIHRKSLDACSYLHKPLSQLYTSQFHRTSRNFVLTTSGYRRFTSVCSFGSERRSGNSNEDSPWKALEKAMGGIKKERSIQDLLREQIEKQAEGGGIGDPPSNGGRGGGGGGDDSENESPWDELLQVTLATLGFTSMYVYILRGAELTRLVRDLIKFLLTKQMSYRLSMAIFKLNMFMKMITGGNQKKKKPYLLEKGIATTPTWYNPPQKPKKATRSLAYE